MDITIILKIHRIPTNNITVFTFHRIKYFSWNLRIYVYRKSVLTQIVLIMASVDLDEDELDQISDMQSLFKYLYGEDVANTIVEDIPNNIIEDIPNNIIEEMANNIVEEIPDLEELLEIEIYEEEIPKEYKRATIDLGDRNMPAKVRNKFMCVICKQLYNNDHLKKHYLNEHNKVQCNKCGVLLDADDVKAIRIHNKNCYIGFKNRNFVSGDFIINTLTALENSIVTYQCLLRRPPSEKDKDEIIRDNIEDVLSKFQL